MTPDHPPPGASPRARDEDAALPACPACSRPVDPLRAGHVAVLGGRFEYFCSRACKEDYLEGRIRDEEPTAAPPEVALAPSTAPRASIRSEAPEAPRPSARSDAPESGQTTTAAARERRRGANADRATENDAMPSVAPRPDRVLLAVDVAGMCLGALAPAIALLGPLGERLRLPLVVAAAVALILRTVRARSDASDPHPLVATGPAFAAVTAACWAALEGDVHTIGVDALAGIGIAVTIAVERVIARLRAPVRAAWRDTIDALRIPVRVAGDAKLGGEGRDAAGEGIRSPEDVRPGEPVLVEAGEFVGVDGVVARGEARVVPWLGARTEVVRREGDAIVAGARVVSDRLRLTTTWSGRERAWSKLVATPDTRIDVAAPTAATLRKLAERSGVVVGTLAGLAAFAENATPVDVLAAAAAAAMALSGRATAAFASLHFAKAHLETLARGITYKDARAFERAAAVDVAVLNARGTVLLGEPEIAVIESVGATPTSRGTDDSPPSSAAARAESEANRVLALAAGALGASSDPLAAAVVNMARTRGIKPDPVRNATVHPGAGVAAIASGGERLVVGRRTMLLEQHIGVAIADARTTALEAEGLSVLLVAIADRVVGLVAMQDGLRAGARAAIQKLLDAGVEPVLLSGEARETCDAIGAALDIDHVRPEVLPEARGGEVQALAGGGAVVGVIGHAVVDDGALGAADVAVAMGAAGGTPREWAVALASDDVPAAAVALTIPRVARSRVRTAIALGAAPAVVAALAIGYGVAPLALAPLSALLGAAAAAVHARETSARPFSA